jgi:hypothetical protein
MYERCSFQLKMWPANLLKPSPAKPIDLDPEPFIWVEESGHEATQIETQIDSQDPHAFMHPAWVMGERQFHTGLAGLKSHHRRPCV